MAVSPRALIAMMMLSLGSTGSLQAADGDDALPPPPDAQALNDEATFHLALVVNYRDTQQVVPVIRRQNAFFVDSENLRRAGLPADRLPKGEVNVSTLPEVRVEYDSSGQRLMLFVPREWVGENSTSFTGDS